MIFRVKNTGPNELPLTVRKDNYFNKHKYPALILHVGQTIDLAQWHGVIDTLWDTFFVLVTSRDFMREYLAGTVRIVAFAP